MGIPTERMWQVDPDGPQYTADELRRAMLKPNPLPRRWSVRLSENQARILADLIDENCAVLTPQQARVVAKLRPAEEAS